MQVSPLLRSSKDADSPFSFFAKLIVDKSDFNQNTKSYPVAPTPCEVDTPAGTSPSAIARTTNACSPVVDSAENSLSSTGSESETGSECEAVMPLKKKYNPIARVKSRYALVHKGMAIGTPMDVLIEDVD